MNIKTIDFKKDLEFGQNYEKTFIPYIIKDYDSIKVVDGYHKEYDIIAYKDEIPTKYEIKADRLASITGNIAIEYIYDGKPSGITSTTSNFYGYFIINKDKSYKLYIIPTEYINKCIQQNLYKKILKGGYNFKSQMYIFNIETFSDFLQ